MSPTPKPAASPDAAVVPLFLCRNCKRPAVRYLPGRRRSFYCDEHGPSKLTDWDRLKPIPVEDYEVAPRTMAVLPPMPAKLAKLLDAFAYGLREILADLTDARESEQARAEIDRLRAEVARVTRERDDAEAIAEEAMSLWPTVPHAAQDLADAFIAESAAPPINRRVRERDRREREHDPAHPLGRRTAVRRLRPAGTPFPPLDRAQSPQDRPEADSGESAAPSAEIGPSSPRSGPNSSPAAPQRGQTTRQRASKGFSVTAPPPSAAALVRLVADEPKPPASGETMVERPSGPGDAESFVQSALDRGVIIFHRFPRTDLECHGMLALVTQLPDPPDGQRPRMTHVSRRALKDFDGLTTADKQAVLDTISLLDHHPEALKEDTLQGTDPKLTALRANRRKRLLCEKQGGEYHLKRIVDRSDSTYYRSER